MDAGRASDDVHMWYRLTWWNTSCSVVGVDHRSAPSEVAVMAIPSPYRQLPLALPTPAPDRSPALTAARAALATADHAADALDRRRATAALAAELASVARVRGRRPAPKSGHRASFPAQG
jgi:hypothetical protein